MRHRELRVRRGGGVAGGPGPRPRCALARAGKGGGRLRRAARRRRAERRDVAATSSFFAAAGLDDAPLLVLDLAGSDGVVPDVGNVSPEVAETVNLFFYACDRLIAGTRRPFPTAVDPCRVPR